MSDFHTEDFARNAQKALGDKQLHSALKSMQARLGTRTFTMYDAIPEGGEALRKKGQELRKQAIENLDVLLETLAENIEKRGGNVYFAATAQDAVEYTRRVAQKHNVRSIVKGKSMLTEEIGLNAALDADGVEVLETDLGEYIVQLLGDAPSHIIAPAIHLTREQIGRLFAQRLDVPYTEDIPSLTKAARDALRKKFLNADMGVTGGNMACAESGQIAIVSNEGNIRMASTLPKVHVALLGMEKIAAGLHDHNILLRLLTRGASAQNMSTYVSYVGGPKAEDESHGPEEFHLVIVDNGRSRILADPEFRESLNCIRCGGCPNVCPVYAKVGGHSYGFPYCGPIGAVQGPLFAGINKGKDLCQGETLCGACKDICPVNNDLPRMISQLRYKLAYGDPEWDVAPASHKEQAVYKLWSWLISNRKIYDAGLKAAKVGESLVPELDGMLTRLPPPFSGWTKYRNMPPLAQETFSQRWKRSQMKKSGDNA